jgi:hypothetical protein
MDRLFVRFLDIDIDIMLARFVKGFFGMDREGHPRLFRGRRISLEEITIVLVMGFM